MNNRIVRHARLAEMPGIGRVQIAQTSTSATERGFTIILRAEAALDATIRGSAPYQYPWPLRMSVAHVLNTVKQWVRQGQLLLMDNELIALSLAETDTWQGLGVTYKPTTGIITVPQITADGSEKWRDHLVEMPRMYIPDRSAQYFDVVVMPERVPLTGMQDLRQHALVSRGWNVLGTDEEAISAAMRYMRDAVDRAGFSIRAT